MDLDDEEMSKLSIARNPLSPPYRTFLLTIYPCVLGASPPCADMETEIDGRQMIVTLNRYSFNAENKSNPVKVIPFIDTVIYLEKIIQVQKGFTYSTTEVYDDQYDFFGEKLKIRYHEIDKESTNTNSRAPQNFCDATSTDFPNDCDPLVSIHFDSGGKKTKLKRTYKKFLEIFGELGGFVEIAIGFATIIYLFTKCSNSDDKLKEEMLKQSDVDSYKQYFTQEDIQKDPKEDTKKRDQTFEEITNEMIKDNIDGVKLISRTSVAHLVSEMIFDKNELALLPLVHLQLAKKRKEQEQEKKCKNNFISFDNSVAPFKGKNKLESAKNEPELTPELAYQNILASDFSNNALKQYVKDYILENLPEKFKGQANNKESKLKDSWTGIVSAHSHKSGKRFEMAQQKSRKKFKKSEFN